MQTETDRVEIERERECVYVYRHTWICRYTNIHMHIERGMYIDYVHVCGACCMCVCVCVRVCGRPSFRPSVCLCVRVLQHRVDVGSHAKGRFICCPTIAVAILIGALT